MTRWLTTVGQCLACGGRGGWPGIAQETIPCSRCDATGRDPHRYDDWFMEHCAPIQLSAEREWRGVA